MIGGIKLKSHKSSTRYEKIQNLPIPDEVILYTSQNVGAASLPVVQKGDTVKKGQIIASAQGECSVPLHASISGRVKEITIIDKPGGRTGEAMIIKKEGEQALELMEPVREITPESIRGRVKEAGIVGMGGAGFPTHIKLTPPKLIKTAFLNGCECEPHLTADETLMVEEAEKVLEGFILTKIAVGAEKGIIGIEEDKEEAINNIKKAVKGQSDIEVLILPKIYPQGYEKMLITAAVKKEVPSGGLPHDIGASVHNVGTCFAIYDAVHNGAPLTMRALTITGSCMINAQNVWAPVGMSVADILSYYQIETKQNPSNAEKCSIYEVYLGGPMMGIGLDTLDVGILKTTSGILVEVPHIEKEYPCVACGKCVDVCPMSLIPQQLNRFYDGKDWEKISENGLNDCMECGCCSYACPSKIPLTYKFKTAKTLVK